jgi:hypothetical protein
VLAFAAVDQVEQGAQQLPQPLAAWGAQRPQGGVGQLAPALQPPPVHQGDRQLLGVPAPRPQHLQRVAWPPRQRQRDRADQRAEQRQGQHQRQPPQRGRLEHRGGGVALGEVAGVVDRAGAAAAVGRGAEVAQLGGRHRHHPPAQHVHAPAQVQVVAEGGHALVEAAGADQGGAAHQHAGGGHEVHVADLVVLALVDLVVLDRGDRPAGAVDRPADLLQAARVRPADQLGAQDHRVRAAVGLDQQVPKRLRVGRGVVVEQPEPVHPGGALVAHGGHDRPAELAPDRQHRVVAEPLAGPVGGAVGRAGVDHQDVVDRTGLRREPPEGVAQERPAVVGDDHRDDPGTAAYHVPATLSPRRE